MTIWSTCKSIVVIITIKVIAHVYSKRLQEWPFGILPIAHFTFINVCLVSDSPRSNVKTGEVYVVKNQLSHLALRLQKIWCEIALIYM